MTKAQAFDKAAKRSKIAKGKKSKGANAASWFYGQSFNGRLRDMEKPEVFGYELDRETLTPKKIPLPTYPGKDYGADPIGDGTFRMVPSGEIVSAEERNRRLTPIKKGN